MRELLVGWVAGYYAVVDVESFVDSFELVVCAVFGGVEPVGLEVALPHLVVGREAADVVEGCDLLRRKEAGVVCVKAAKELGHQGVEKRRAITI